MLAHAVTVLDILVYVMLLSIPIIIALLLAWLICNCVANAIFRCVLKMQERRMYVYMRQIKDWMETGCRPEAMPKY